MNSATLKLLNETISAKTAPDSTLALISRKDDQDDIFGFIVTSLVYRYRIALHCI